MRFQQRRALLNFQIIPDLLVAQARVDLLGNLLAHRIGPPARVGIAAGQRVEVTGARIAADLAGAIDAGEEPVDALIFSLGPIDVWRIVALQDVGGRFGASAGECGWPMRTSARSTPATTTRTCVRLAKRDALDDRLRSAGQPAVLPCRRSSTSEPRTLLRDRASGRPRRLGGRK